jgi:hypothetical protein
MLYQLEEGRRKAIREKAAGMPPKQRLDHLRKRHREETAELRRLIKVQEATENELQLLKTRSREEYDAVESQRETVEDIRVTIEEAELDLPPTGKPKPIGRQHQQEDLRTALQKSSIPEILEELSTIYDKAFGAAISEESIFGRRTRMGFNMLQAAHDELTAELKAQRSQEEADRRAAMKLHHELNSEVQSGDKRGRAINVDRWGDESMQEVGGDGSDDGGDWQVKGGRKKGKGRDSAPAALAAMPSATVSVNPILVGPLATTPRPRGTASSSARHQPPRQSCGSGTPKTAMASGTLQSLSEQPAQDTTAAGASAAASTSATQQQTAVESQSAAQDESETPQLDSLPSTPRAPDRNPNIDEEETPNPFAPVGMNVSGSPQAREVLAPAAPVVTAEQTMSGSVQMELDFDIGKEQHTLGPVTMPAPSAQPAAPVATAQHDSGSAPQPGDGGSNQ